MKIETQWSIGQQGHYSASPLADCAINAIFLSFNLEHKYSLLCYPCVCNTETLKDFQEGEMEMGRGRESSTWTPESAHTGPVVSP